jgi:hypothetical protein
VDQIHLEQKKGPVAGSRDQLREYCFLKKDCCIHLGQLTLCQLKVVGGGGRNRLLNLHLECSVYECVSKSFRTGRLERQLQMVQLSATRCSCIAIL